MKIKKFDISKLDQWKINKKKIYHASNDFLKQKELEHLHK